MNLNVKQAQPEVATGVMIFKGGKILLGKRKGSHGAGEYAFPGGKLEFGESCIECVEREVAEECGIKIDNIKFLKVSNERFWPGLQFLNLGFTADWVDGEPTVLEPDKCDNWGWYVMDNLPRPLFPSIPHFLEALKTGKTFFDS